MGEKTGLFGRSSRLLQSRDYTRVSRLGELHQRERAVLEEYGVERGGGPARARAGPEGLAAEVVTRDVHDIRPTRRTQIVIDAGPREP